MCFVTTPYKRAKIAKEDIYVYKMLKVTDSGLYAPYQGDTYELHKVYNCKKLKKRVPSTGEINEGLHSYKDPVDAQRASKILESKGIRSVYIAVIPEGSLYYENELHYCSNKLKVINLKVVV